MSNQQVGTVYQQIIADVVESSRVDFEEGGVDEHVLEELRMGWQSKLSQLQVAAFPWDPKPEPQPTIANPPTVPSNAGHFNMNTPPQQNQGLTMPQMNNNQNQGPRIKPEPGLEDDNSPPQLPNFPNPMINLPNATTAQQRAAQHLQNNYGQRAAASINAIQSTAGGQQQQQQGQGQGPSQQQQGPPNPQSQQRMHPMNPHHLHHHQMAHSQQQRVPQQQQGQRPAMTQEQYRAAMARNAAIQQQQLQNQNGGLNGAQTDGAGDDEEVEGLSVIKRFDSAGNEISMGRIEIDGLIRSKIQAMGQSMEGGGLMLPLQQASTKTKRQRKVSKKGKDVDVGGDAADDDDDKGTLGLKDEEFDEDAINSDLDDPDDGLNDEEDDEESMGHIMLCMYDKVQRVKNKWKCVMKDGVLTVNGKEYVFHKASGEYEW